MTDLVKTRITQTDLFEWDAEAKDRGKRIEIEDGDLIELERTVTHLHQIVIENLYDMIKPLAKKNKWGYVHTAGLGYILIGTRDDVIMRRYPDFSFIREGRIADDYDWMGDFEGAPDLAVKVVSPGQTIPLLQTRIAEYLKAGTSEMWLLYQKRCELHQYQRDADTLVIYKAEDTVDTAALFPGLVLRVGDVFATK